MKFGIEKLVFSAFVLSNLSACALKFKEKNELALPPFFKEEYEQMVNEKKNDSKTTEEKGDNKNNKK